MQKGHADDTAILASNLEDLQYILDRVTEVGEQFGLVFASEILVLCILSVQRLAVIIN